MPPLESDSLADSQAGSRQEPEEQPPTPGKEPKQHGQLGGAHRPHLFLFGVFCGRPVWQVHVPGGVRADQALADGRGEARAQRRHDVPHGRVRQRPPLCLLVAQPSDEPRNPRWRDLRQSCPLGEVLEHVLFELAAVVLARSLPEPAPTAALVALHPLQRVLVQRDAGALIELSALDVGGPCGLRAASLIDGPEALVALLAVRAVRDHAAGTPLVDAGIVKAG
jgi:hypothetical protein